jgi:putative oxidoreductase
VSNSPLFAGSPRQQGLALALVRIILGITFLAHGYQKFFVMGISGVQGGFTKMGVPMPGVSGLLVTLLEFAGGIGLIIGLLTRLIALGLAIDMLGAMAFVHFANGFFLPTGYEFVLLLLVLSLALVIGGPGRLAVDNVIANRG